MSDSISPVLTVPQLVIAGVDEAGRGCLAGPVVAAAVIIDPEKVSDQLTDSKKLSPEQRDHLYDDIIREADAYSIQSLSSRLVDKHNIFRATMLAMKRAILALDIKPQKVLIDGNKTPDVPDIELEAIVKGDLKIKQISAASILAKVSRDRIMINLHKKFPEYHFDVHKGYATQQHYDAIFKHGPINVHRRSFNLNKQESLFG